MLAILVVGSFAAATVLVAAWAFRRSPTRCNCPECGDRTRIVQLPRWLRRNPFIHVRWCARCGWEGWARNGPEWIPGHPLAHDSGFHWGSERFQPDFGFRFRGPGRPARSSLDHPSGFHFTHACSTAPAGAEWTPEALPVALAGEASHAGFSFGTPKRGTHGVGPGQFRWKGVG